jgi:hypothetical protein
MNTQRHEGLCVNMTTYLSEVRAAGEQILDLIRRDSDALANLEARRAQAFALFSLYRESAMTIGGPFSDDVDYEAEAAKAQLHHGRNTEAEAEIARYESAMEARRLSRSVLAGAILQLGKQGISAVHGRDRDNAPTGDAVGGQCERDVIWEGRNQAMHWEEGSLSKRVRDCFDQLERDFGPHFDNYDREPKAPEVLSVLGWGTWPDVEARLLRFS